MFLRQEDHAHAVFAGGRQAHALRGHFFAVELVRNLDQDTGAVAHQRVRADGTPVVQVLQDLQALGNDLVGLLALDVRDHADAAGVVLVGRVVHALRLRTQLVQVEGGGRLADLLAGLRLGRKVLHLVHGLNSGEGCANCWTTGTGTARFL
ncbi:hypothetical protein D3C72_1309180 [compost metagenome]